MQRICVLMLMAAGCAPANYAYNFDLIDPGARNLTRPGERDTLEDPFIKTEILVDPTSFQAILLDITNKTPQPLGISWDQIVLVQPDGSTLPLHPDQPSQWVEPGAKVVARLIPFALPTVGDTAKAYDKTKFELVVPMTITGTMREYRYHLFATVQKL